MVEYVCSVLDKGRRNEETRRRKALPNNEDAVLIALGVVLNTIYKNRDVVCKTHDRTLYRLVKACVAGRSDKTNARAFVHQVRNRVWRGGQTGGGVRGRGKVVHAGD